MVATVHYLAELKEIPTIEARNAELALFRREPAEAEAILVGGLAVVSFYLYGFVQVLPCFIWVRPCLSQK